MISSEEDVTVCFITTQLHWQSEYDIIIYPSDFNGLKNLKSKILSGLINMQGKIVENEPLKIDSEEMKPFSLEEFNQRIDKSMSDSKEGKLTENKDLLAEIKEWR